MSKPTINQNLIRSFGRVNGRKLRPTQRELMEEVLPGVEIRLGEKEARGEGMEIATPLSLEIGFGYGEHLAGMAMRYPGEHFIGCEPFVNGVAALIKYIKEDNIENIRIFHGDARLLMEGLPDASISRAFILFPDPWPKSRHHKKRIISQENLKLLARIIKPGGRLEIATDHVDYGNWIAQHLAAQQYFIPNDTIGANAQPEDWIPTRYQKKAEQEGRGARFFNYVRGN